MELGCVDEEALSTSLTKEWGTEEQTQALKACIQKRPQLAYLLKNYSKFSLSDYASHLLTSKSKCSETFKGIVLEELKPFFSNQIIERARSSLESVSSVDTAAHGGIISEDCTLQEYLMLSKDAIQKKIPVFFSFACGVIPMNNLTWPRGFYFNGERISLFSKSFDRVAFHECPALTRDQIETRLKDQSIPQDAKNILEFIAQLPNIYDYRSFFEQCTLINYSLFEGTFNHDSRNASCIQLMLESITKRLLIHELQNEGEVAQLLFDTSRIPHLIDKLSDLPGTWNKELSKGTFLFWHRSGDFRAASVFLKDSQLVGQKIAIAYTREEILSAVSKGELVPSVFLSLLLLLKHGVRSVGGYHQCWYLPQYIDNLRKIYQLEFLQKISCEDLIQIGYGFGFYPSKTGSQMLAGLETFFGNPVSVQDAEERLPSSTVENALKYSLKRWYAEIVPVSERKIPLDALAVDIT